MKNLTRALLILPLFATFASGGQQKVWYGQPLTVDVAISESGVNTKFAVTFRNRGNLPVENLKIQKVGLPIFCKDFCPPYRVPTIRPGKTYTLNVFIRGKIAVANSEEVILVTGSYRSGRDSVVLNRQIKYYCN